MLVLLACSLSNACSICLGGLRFPPGQQLDVAEQAVIAAPSADGKRWRVVQVVKGRAVAGHVISGPVDGADSKTIPGGKPSLLLRYEYIERWTSVGTIGIDYAGWLRQLVTTGQRKDGKDIDWRGRVALVAPHLEDPEPLAADIAYGEIVRAPYGALRSLKPGLKAETISRWLDNPKLAARRSAYTLLLGITGGQKDAERLEKSLEAAWAAHNSTNLSAMLAADLELRGPSRVAWIETKYIRDRRRTMPEISAALKALSEHGKDNVAVPRTRVIEAYIVLIRERRPMAGFVAGQLSEWGYCDAASLYAELLKSNLSLDPASRSAIVTYLESCPSAKARTPFASQHGAEVGFPDANASGSRK